MIDTSRCGVPKVQTVEQMIDYLAVMGYSMVMLYSEDTITIEGRPYFGYMRGRYTPDQLRAIDDYAFDYGIEAVLPHLPSISCAIIGEPTSMQPAIAEKGLMVLDCVAEGVSGHAARNEGVNAIYKAIADIEWFRTHRYTRTSELLGDVKMTVTQINAGTQHNVIPDKCSYVVDIRSNECYSNKELLDIIKLNVSSCVTARSTRLNSSSISIEHPLVQRAVAMGSVPYGSPTLSNQALVGGIPTLKMGPGDTTRSHTANEYVLISEIRDGIEKFCTMLDGMKL
jgi:acetylornithine deacetylase